MRAVVQRVARAEVEVAGQVVGQIEQGLLVYVGVAVGDREADARWLADKVLNLRIFDDNQGRLNLSVQDVRGGVLAVTNFTLCASAQKGRRPSFDGAINADKALPLTQALVEALKGGRCPIHTGQFGEHMLIRSEADGPVNLIIETPAAAGP